MRYRIYSRRNRKLHTSGAVGTPQQSPNPAAQPQLGGNVADTAHTSGSQCNALQYAGTNVIVYNKSSQECCVCGRAGGQNLVKLAGNGKEVCESCFESIVGEEYACCFCGFVHRSETNCVGLP